MADILTLLFRTFMSQSDLKKSSAADPPTDGGGGGSGSTVLLVGDPSISRSVLLLAAVTAASELGVRVVFLTHTAIQSLPACLQKCVPSLNPESLKKIRFSYPRTAEELLQQVAGLHESMSPVPPSLVVVDRLESFLGAGERSCAAHLAALLCDTAAFFTRVLQRQTPSSAPCRLLVSFQSDSRGAASATDPVLDLLSRYFQVRCSLDQDSGYEAAAAGLQQLWHVYLSGTDITDAAGVREWELLVFPDGLLEFKLL